MTKSERLITQSLSDHKAEALSIDLAVQYADVLLALGKHAQAEQLMSESFERAKTDLGMGHPHTADCLNHWLFSMQEQRKLWEAQMLGFKNLGTLLGNYSAANGSPEELPTCM